MKRRREVMNLQMTLNTTSAMTSTEYSLPDIFTSVKINVVKARS